MPAVYALIVLIGGIGGGAVFLGDFDTRDSCESAGIEFKLEAKQKRFRESGLEYLCITVHRHQ